MWSPETVEQDIHVFGCFQHVVQQAVLNRALDSAQLSYSSIDLAGSACVFPTFSGPLANISICECVLYLLGFLVYNIFHHFNTLVSLSDAAWFIILFVNTTPNALLPTDWPTDRVQNTHTSYQIDTLTDTFEYPIVLYRIQTTAGTVQRSIFDLGGHVACRPIPNSVGAV